MKALMLREYNHFEYIDVPEPDTHTDEVLVKVHACGICGSDVHGMDGSTGRRISPIIMGHEAAGVIVKIGSEVKRWQVGDRVTFDSTIYSMEDWFTKKACTILAIIGWYLEFRVMSTDVMVHSLSTWLSHNISSIKFPIVLHSIRLQWLSQWLWLCTRLSSRRL